MKEFTTVNDIFDFAINAEQEAVNFYSQLANTSKNEEMRSVFTQFAREEMGHKAKLTTIRTTGQYAIRHEAISDLKIADYLTDVEPSPDMTYQDALILAMKKEKNAFRLYLNLSEKAPSDYLRNLFMSLAQEEAKHKLRFELEYDEYVLREN
ncbi:MAG: ferritin family protein [Bacteroidetes bacterium]|nr:ferritin family protein [Bacteroidota bacterium]